MLRHYSSIIERIRTRIFLIIIAVGAYILGVFHFKGFPIKTESTISWISYWSAILVVVLMMVEISYFRKFNQIILAIRKLERSRGIENTFFQSYRPFTHRVVYAFYLNISIAFLCLSNQIILAKFVPLALMLLAVIQLCDIAELWVVDQKDRGFKLIYISLWLIIFGKIPENLNLKDKLFAGAIFILLLIIIGTLVTLALCNCITLD